MRKLYLLLLCCGISNLLLAQYTDEEELIQAMCRDFERTEHYIDDLRLDMLYERFLKPYYQQFEAHEVPEIDERIFYRLQKVCASFREYLNRVNPSTTGDWVQLSERPEATLSEADLQAFRETEHFYYKEHSGAITQVHVQAGKWMDIFTDGTISSCYFRWKAGGKFELEFIESNNYIRHKFSKPGELFQYEVISKEENFYWVLLDLTTQNDFYLFRLYFR